MKTRKRGRSPNQDCEECLPIAKRITRLNIQSANIQGGEEDVHSCSPGVNCSCGSDPNGPLAGPSWPQYGPSGSGLQPSGSGLQPSVNNNNRNGYMCGSQQDHNTDLAFMCSSHQCHSADMENVKHHALQTYASLHDLNSEDLTGYKPDLSKGQNPHYFQINSVLYEAHLEKACRQGHNLKK